MDTPGHPDFFDDVCVSVRLCDNALLVVDVLEGVTLHLEKLIQLAIHQRKPIIVVLNCIDRLILELRLPPADAYHKNFERCKLLKCSDIFWLILGEMFVNI